jgi:hypothetical protein
LIASRAFDRGSSGALTHPPVAAARVPATAVNAVSMAFKKTLVERPVLGEKPPPH